MTTDSNSILSSSPLHLAAGQKLAGCYVLERPLEVGGSHLIWIAEDEVLGKRVSLHFLPPEVTRDSVAVGELRQEVKRCRPLIHPGVLRVYDLVEGDDWTAVAMEAFEGRCLAAILKEKGRFEVDEVEAWLDQICVTLEEAQRIKLTHRDLAPDNIFVTSAGRLLMANFGLSRVVHDSLARSGGGGGGPARLSTLSPQLQDGASPSPTDDVYGVGTLFFEMLTGQPVFSGGDIADKIRHAVPPRISEVRSEASDMGRLIPEGWDNVIAACLNKESDERPQRPSEIVSSIEAYAPAVEPLRIAPAEPQAVAEKDDALTEIEPVPTPPAVEIGPDEPPALLAEPVELVAMPEPVELEKEIEPATMQFADAKEAESVEEKEAEPVVSPVIVEAAAPSPLPEAAPAPIPEAAVAPKQEPRREPKPEPKPFTPRPVQLYDTEEDAFSAILPRRFRFPAAVAAAVILLLFLINGFFTSSKDKAGSSPSIATSDSNDRSELTSVTNPANGSSETTPGELVKREVAAPPEATAAEKAPAMQTIVIPTEAASSSPPAASNSIAMPSSGSPVDKDIAEKSAAVERLKQELATTEKAQQASVKEQQVAAAALAEVQKAIDEKMKSAEAAKKVADELLVARKKREDDQKEAEAAARAAQQLAAEKTRVAEDAKKALADFESQNRDKLAAQDKAGAEIKALQQTLTERQKIAEDNFRATAAADAARQQQISALQKNEQELAAAKASVAKVSIDEERRRQALNAERQKLDDEIAAMREKMKDIEDRRRQIEGGAKTPTALAAKALLPPIVEAKVLPVATPPPTLSLMAMKTETAPSATPAPPIESSIPVVTSASVNSLGMKFAPVGDVFFCVWQTRMKDFETFAKTMNLKSTAWRGPGFRQGPDHPVVNVTWTEAIAFCKWLSDKEHKEGSLPANQFYRLPYDLEWSKAVSLPDETGKTPEARDMGVPDVYPWGTDWPPSKGAGNYTGEETGSDVAIKGYDDGFAWTSPVGSFPPNKFGLYDMGGNVWQWCMDSWNNESKAKVLRGASWYNGALKLSLLSSCRVHAAPDSSTDNYGFRIVRATEIAGGKAAKK